MSTTYPVRVLYVEDDPGAALLFQRRLSRDNYVVEIARDGEHGLITWVTGAFDVLAVDQDMPRMKGLELLRELAARGPLPPTVMVTGAGNETIAVEAMKLGADDYIIKDTEARYLDLIPSVIERALEKRRLLEEKRLADDELRESRNRLRKSQEMAHVGSWELDLLNDRLIWSDEVHRIYGVEPHQFKGRHQASLEVTHPDDRSMVKSAFDRSLQEEEDHYEIEHRIVRKHTGEVRYVHEKWEHLRDASGRIYRCVGMVQDITERKNAEQKILAQRNLFSLMFENAPYVLLLINRDLRVENINRRGVAFAGRPKESLLGSLGGEIFKCVNAFIGEGCGRNPPCLTCPIRSRVIHTFHTGEPLYQEEGRLTLAYDLSQRNELDFLVSTTLVTVEDAEMVLVTIIDITDHKKAHEAQREGELWLQSIFRSLEEGIVTVTPDGVVKDINPAVTKIFGYTRKELVGASTEMLHVDSQHYSEFQARIREAFDQGESAELEFEARRKSGEIFPTEHSVSLLRGRSEEPIGILSVIRDITIRKKARDQITASLREKEVLLREIHHRVKNNLAVITSFIRMQSHYATNKTPKEAFEEVQARIRSMALVHEILYQSTNLAYLNVADYFETLLAHLFNSYGRLGTDITVERYIKDASFGLDTAIPLGILMTELVSNCFKHAFPDGRSGRIIVSLHAVEHDTFELRVADDGVGIPETIDLNNPQSMGLDLIDTFVEQLSGKIKLVRDNGTEIRIRFREVDKRSWA